MTRDLIPPHLAVLYHVSSIVSSSMTLDQMLAALLRAAADVTRCDACLIYLPDENGDIVLRASQLPHSAEIGNMRLKSGEGVTGWVAGHNSVVALARNASSDPRFKRMPLVEDTYEALLSVPLVSGGAVIGVLNVHHKASHAHTPEEIAILSFVGEQLGGAIARARLETETARLSGELEARKIVERAKGILQRTYSLTEEEAYLRLRNESRRSRRPMRELAQAIIMAENLGRNAGA